MNCKKILIVDDDEAVRKTMQMALEIQGYDAITACDGKEGIERLKEAQGTCVILLDMMMPGMNGWQFLDFQRDNPEFSKIPVIVCSAYYESARSVKPQTFLPKPVELRSLVNAVKSYCA